MGDVHPRGGPIGDRGTHGEGVVESSRQGEGWDHFRGAGGAGHRPGGCAYGARWAGAAALGDQLLRIHGSLVGSLEDSEPTRIKKHQEAIRSSSEFTPSQEAIRSPDICAHMRMEISTSTGGACNHGWN